MTHNPYCKSLQLLWPPNFFVSKSRTFVYFFSVNIFAGNVRTRLTYIERCVILCINLVATWLKGQNSLQWTCNRSRRYRRALFCTHSVLLFSTNVIRADQSWQTGTDDTFISITVISNTKLIMHITLITLSFRFRCSVTNTYNMQLNN